MSTAPLVLGVDGCKGGWIVMARPGHDFAPRLFDRFGDLINCVRELDVHIMIDIPIGLPHAGAPVRECDREARQLLRGVFGRPSSVFPAPSREAAHSQSLEQAKANNLRAIGKSLTTQAWSICNKIAEVDIVLREDPSLLSRVSEVHPEVCFAVLNGGMPMSNRKSKSAGRAERLELLSKFDPRNRQLVDEAMTVLKGSAVKYDDVIDALVAAHTVPVGARKIPATPQLDETGIPMSMQLPSLEHRTA